MPDGNIHSLDSSQIQEIIPHRKPFLFVDRIEEVEFGKRAVGVIDDINRHKQIISGHFPGFLVMPGALLVEALAEVGAVAALGLEQYQGKIGVLAGLDEWKFRTPLRPGMRARLEADLIRLRGNFGKGHLRATLYEDPSVLFCEGFVFAEGAATLILERLDHALERKAPIFAELVAYGDKGDAHHETAPATVEGYDDPEKPYLNKDLSEAEKPGSVRAMEQALRRAKITPEGNTRIDYINAHGTATDVGDAAEVAAIEYAFRNFDRYPLVSSTKSMTGHLLGAAGGLESIMCIMAINEGIIPPTINLNNSIPTKLDLVPNKARETNVDIAMNNSFGFGGINHVVIFSRFVG